MRKRVEMNQGEQGVVGMEYSNPNPVDVADFFMDLGDPLKNPEVNPDHQEVFKLLGRLYEHMTSIASLGMENKFPVKPTPEALLSLIQDKVMPHKEALLKLADPALLIEEEGSALTNPHVIRRKKVDLSEPPLEKSQVIKRVKRNVS